MIIVNNSDVGRLAPRKALPPGEVVI